MYVHKTYATLNEETFDNCTCEAVICTVPNRMEIICTAYRPPDASTIEFQQLIDFIEDYLSKIENVDQFELKIMGDFNFPKMKLVSEGGY